MAHIAGSLLGVWGAVVFLKGVYDLFIGEPEANLFAPQKWAFVTQEQWLRYAFFESAYGLACLALAWAVFRYARFLPELLSRPKRDPEFQLFD